jgi:hypothetical protein
MRHFKNKFYGVVLISISLLALTGCRGVSIVKSGQVKAEQACNNFKAITEYDYNENMKEEAKNYLMTQIALVVYQATAASSENSEYNSLSENANTLQNSMLVEYNPDVAQVAWSNMVYACNDIWVKG